MADLIAITRRFKDLVLKYTTDLNQDTLVKQRLYRLENAGQPINIETVITPLLLARLQDGEKPTNVPKFKGQPRKMELCLPVLGLARSPILSTIVCYNPSDPLHNLNIIEMLLFPGVLNGKYFGESGVL